MKIYRLVILLITLFLLAACGAKTKVAVMDDSVVGHKNIHVIVVSDDVDDPLDVGDFLAEAFQDNGISAEVRTANKAIGQLGSGSGFVVAKNYWITNHHVVKDLDKITISIVGKDLPATLIKSDPQLDLALLKAFTDELKPIKIGEAEMGEEIYTIGYPLPDMLGSHARITTGVVSSLHGFGGSTKDIQISAPIQPGNSGGPVVGNNWELAGVVVSTASTSKMASRSGVLPQGLNFAVSPNYVKGFLLQNGISPQEPYAESIGEVIASTGLVWNGDLSKRKRTYIASFSYNYYWDLGDHIRSLRIHIIDGSTKELIIKSNTRSAGIGVTLPAKQAVEQILVKVGLRKE
ncbi:MAG: serine protease [Pseudodesulfovibrio sp.]